ncbi:23S rRNA (adenine(2030)-N(6))-methyltransferase RlmJ [Larsenimonas sp. GH2-1]|uniref:Ribosomal RNA large subunit methyltransferase J n=1 Tax=Larsenimonas rhizosphaerae TaxID=2944682 RepID=A0AA41ZET9_9GAMM|nr:23S rRNA (adenine(2030)-N(6))-methyltransferase RlmJ [Larsenimonas rhizosphaerae]
MLSYQHAYHAGNIADVHKHLALYGVIDHLLRKDSGVTYIDTHAGRGAYSVTAPEMARGLEYEDGVAPLMRMTPHHPLLSEWLLRLGQQQDNPQKLMFYPGSPWWLADRLRAQDRLELFELHPGEFTHLEHQTFLARAQCRQTDGLAGVVARLPSSTPRTMVIIDPSFELKQEYSDVAETVSRIQQMARHAIVLIWYPLLPAARHQELLDHISALGVRKVWRSELVRRDPGAQRGMYGSGLLIVNPPWQVPEQLDDALAEVAGCWGEQAGHTSSWWCPE